MNDSERIQNLERQLLELQATNVFQTQCIAVLLALIEYSAANLGIRLVKRPVIRDLYMKMIREETDKFLAGISDHDPAAASALREVLKSQLGDLPEIQLGDDS